MIVDESDERMFKDLSSYYCDTKSKKVKTICLTATAYEGAEGSEMIEEYALKKLGYKVYKNSSKKEDFEPTIHEAREIGTLEAYRTLILKESERACVLIYATGTEYESLK